ncbi:MAG: hypothetical protein ACOYN4_03515 [Bacteroidales bacterium]
MEKILANEVKGAGLWGEAQKLYFPLITKEGVNEQGKTVHYLFNYSSASTTVNYMYNSGDELLLNKTVNKNSIVALEPWGISIIEEQ